MRSLTIGFVAALAAVACAGAQPQPPPPIARVESGTVAGAIEASVRVFHSIPYAAPPVGPLRWRSPAPPQPWTGVRDASHEGPACEQPVRPDGRPNGGGYAGPVNEDCLTLTITAPAGAGRAPVLVWLPGGANIFGGANVPSYDGAGFARDGVILVSVNYRLGAFGFLAHPALTAEAPAAAPLGDYGLEDQIAALKWVQRNIAAFGGDPARVTLAGESAGGEDTLALMTAPAARGLFRQAIVESGLGWGKDDSLADREAQGAALVAKLGLLASAGPADLRAVPADQILAAQGFPWGPTLDHRLIRQSPAQAFASGVEAPVPLIIGSNSFEASLMALFGGGTDRMLASASPELKAAYAPENLDPAHLAWALFGDRTMTGPARWIAARHSARAPTFLYHFSYVITAHRAQQPGANHAGEIPFAFDSQEAVPSRAAILTDEDRAATRFMHGCWVSFIKTGAPSCAAGGQVWPAYASASDELLEFAIQPAVVAHFHQAELDAQEKANAADLTP